MKVKFRLMKMYWGQFWFGAAILFVGIVMFRTRGGIRLGSIVFGLYFMAIGWGQLWGALRDAWERGQKATDDGRPPADWERVE